MTKRRDRSGGLRGRERPVTQVIDYYCAETGFDAGFVDAAWLLEEWLLEECEVVECALALPEALALPLTLLLETVANALLAADSLFD